MSELARKLRLPVGGRVAVVNPPDGYLAALGLPATGADSGLDFVQLFARAA